MATTRVVSAPISPRSTHTRKRLTLQSARGTRGGMARTWVRWAKGTVANHARPSPTTNRGTSINSFTTIVEELLLEKGLEELEEEELLLEKGLEELEEKELQHRQMATRAIHFHWGSAVYLLAMPGAMRDCGWTGQTRSSHWLTATSACRSARS